NHSVMPLPLCRAARPDEAARIWGWEIAAASVSISLNPFATRLMRGFVCKLARHVVRPFRTPAPAHRILAAGQCGAHTGACGTRRRARHAGNCRDRPEQSVCDGEVLSRR